MLARIELGKVAFAVSVAVHASVAVVAARHANVALAASVPLAEMPAPDLLPLEPESNPSREPAPAPEAVERSAPEAPARARAHALLPAPAVGASEPAPAPSVSDAPEPSVPRFSLLVTTRTASASSATAVDAGAAAAGSLSDAPVAESTVAVPAKLRAGVPPAYTAAALAAGVESDVPLEIVIDAAGAVVSARPLEHVGYGLDQAALRSVQSYRFSPAQRRGHAVAVRMHWVMRFQLQ
jgi:periplasmic protein TonB